jgi:elongator complex protein 3
MFYTKKGLSFTKFRNFFELPNIVKDNERTKRIQKKLLEQKGIAYLKKELQRNEKSRIRCVGLTIETKPDWGLLEQGNEMLEYGCTRVELGIQATDEKILSFVNRGHGLKESIESTRILKDFGFKINYHMMPGLPLSDPEKDLEMLKETLDNPDYRPDMYKIYPTMVMKGTALYNLWKRGKYNPMTRESAAEVIAEFKRFIPHWIRIMRVQRDIPTYMTEAGVDRTNLRQYIDKKLVEKGIKCSCIRCREAGLMSLKKKISSKELKIFTEGYEASKGKEFFISFEDAKREILFGYCRMRFPSQSLRPEITMDSAIIRELHVVGTATGIGEDGNMQHKGIGKRLLLNAEGIAKKHKKNKLVVISGVGAREYYRNQGYVKEGAYMVKYF